MEKVRLEEYTSRGCRLSRNRVDHARRNQAGVAAVDRPARISFGPAVKNVCKPRSSYALRSARQRHLGDAELLLELARSSAACSRAHSMSPHRWIRVGLLRVRGHGLRARAPA
jgi:hypothetical protein